MAILDEEQTSLLNHAEREALYLDIRLSELLASLESPKRAATKGVRTRTRAAINNIRELRQYITDLKESEKS